MSVDRYTGLRALRTNFDDERDQHRGSGGVGNGGGRGGEGGGDGGAGGMLEEMRCRLKDSSLRDVSLREWERTRRSAEGGQMWDMDIGIIYGIRVRVHIIYGIRIRVQVGHI